MHEPRVLLDATAVPVDRGGVGRYVDALVAALHADGAAPTVVCQPRDAARYAGLAPSAEVVPAGPQVLTRTGRLSWEQAVLPRLVRRLGADVVHSPHYTVPLAAPAARVVTLHDATFFTDPGVHSPVKARFFRAWTRVSLRRAAVAVVPSGATAAELVRVVGADPAALHVAHHGVDPGSFAPPSPDQVARVRALLGLGRDPYVAFLGALEPRKNVPALLDAFPRVAADRPGTALVLAGPPGWDSRVERALAGAARSVRVVRAGYLPLGELAGLLGGADVVAYPSLGEGFGLPVLEAMACGAAVLTSRRLALPEVGGDAVQYCGTSAPEIADGLAALLGDPARRSELSAAAQRRAKEFTWAASAARHREAYGRAALAAR